LSTDGAGNLTWIAPTSGTINTGNIGRFAYYTGATALSETSANLTWNAGTNTLSLTGNLQATNLTVTSNVTVAGNLIYADATNSRVGVGTTSPGFKVHLYQNDTAFSGNTASGSTINTNLYSQFFVAPSSNPTAFFTYYGVLNDVLYNSTANSSNVGIITTASRTQAINTGNVASITGHLVRTVVSSSGNITTSTGQQIALNLTGAGSVSSHYSLYISNPAKSGTGNVVTNYGLYLESQTTGNTTNWGIYSAGGSNYFGGNILVGTTTPSANLTVNGTTNLGPAGNITITGGSSGWVLTTNGAGVLSWSSPLAGGVTSLTNGTSNVIVANSGNVSLSVAGTSNVMVVSSATANVTGTLHVTANVTGGNLITAGILSVTGNANVGNLGAASGVFASTISATGNANVGNVGGTRAVFANLVGTLETASQPNITSVGTLSSLSVTGNANVGNLNVTGNIVDTGALSLITAASGNINLAPNGTNTLVATTTGANITGTLNTTGNANVGNLGTTGNVSAGFFIGNGSLLTGITVGAGTSIVNGTSNVVVAPNGNVTTSVAGTANALLVSSGGITVLGTVTAGALTVDTNTLFVDSVNDRVGVGLTTPAHRLDVRGNSAKIFNGTASADTVLYIGNSDESAPGQGMFLTFHGSAATPYASINSLSQGVAWRNLALLPNGGNVGIGTASPSNKLHVAGIVQIDQVSGTADLYMGSGTTGNSGKITYDNNNVRFVFSLGGSEKMRILSTGEVGIGTTSPAKTLHVHNTVGDNHLYLSNTAPSIIMGNNVTFASSTMYYLMAMATSNGSYGLNAGDTILGNYGNSRGNLHINSNYAGTGTTNVIMQPGSGSVGIGIAPTSKLHLAAAANDGFSITSTDGTTFRGVLYNTNNSALGMGTTTAHGVAFYTSNAERASINSAGDVIIGNASNPGNTLRYLDLYNTNTGASAGTIMRLITSDVAGTGTAVGQIVKYKNGLMSITNSETNAAGAMQFVVGATERMRIDSSGNVGIGVTPAQPFHVYRPTVDSIGTFQGRTTSLGGSGKGGVQLDVDGNGGYALLCNATSGTRAFTISGNNGYGSAMTEFMRIDSSGNVGIGTSSPATKLHVLTANPSTANEVARFQGGTNNSNFRNYISCYTTNVGFWWELSNEDSAGTGSTNGFAFRERSAADPSVVRLYLASGGNVGIGTTSPAYQLQLSTDSAAKPTTNTWTIVSDARLKTVIGEYQKGLAEICQIRPVRYEYNGKNGFPVDGKENISILAQEIMTVFPECVDTFRGKLEEDGPEIDLYNYNGHAITFALINAIKELKAEIDILKAKN